MNTQRAVLAAIVIAVLTFSGCAGAQRIETDPTTTGALSNTATATPTKAAAETEPAAPPVDLGSVAAGPEASLGTLALSRDGSSYDAVPVRVIRPETGRVSYLLARSRTGAPTSFRQVSSIHAYERVSPRPSGAPRFGSCAAVHGGTDLCTGQNAGVIQWTGDSGGTWSEHATALGRLLLSPVASLAPSTLAVVGGSDGATLAPFQAYERSLDGGLTWTRGDFARFEGALAYTGGEVVLSDGRLLALLGPARGELRPAAPGRRRLLPHRACRRLSRPRPGGLGRHHRQPRLCLHR